MGLGPRPQRRPESLFPPVHQRSRVSTGRTEPQSPHSLHRRPQAVPRACACSSGRYVRTYVPAATDRLVRDVQVLTWTWKCVLKKKKFFFFFHARLNCTCNYKDDVRRWWSSTAPSAAASAAARSSSSPSSWRTPLCSGSMSPSVVRSRVRL